MDKDELRQELDSIFRPEADDLPFAFGPHVRLKEVHNLDVSYWNPFEFGTKSRFSRVVKDSDDPINRIVQSLFVPWELQESALRLFADSIVGYHDTKHPRRGPFRYYPSVLMTFWAGFEALVRLQSELLVHIVRSLPPSVALTLLELEEHVERDGRVSRRPRQRPVLERFWLLLKYGHGYGFDRGSKVWQDGERSARKRNEFVHYEVTSGPSITAFELWRHLEAISLLPIAASCEIGRTVDSGQYATYWMLAEMQQHIVDVEERSFLSGLKSAPYSFPCSFENVDDASYPSGSRT